jgi:histidinol phosphatase-like enzyme
MCGDSSKKFNIKDKIYIGDRIRDIAFIQSHNVVIAVLESSGSLGVISK